MLSRSLKRFSGRQRRRLRNTKFNCWKWTERSFGRQKPQLTESTFPLLSALALSRLKLCSSGSRVSMLRATESRNQRRSVSGFYKKFTSRKRLLELTSVCSPERYLDAVSFSGLRRKEFTGTS